MAESSLCQSDPIQNLAALLARFFLPMVFDVLSASTIEHVDNNMYGTITWGNAPPCCFAITPCVRGPGRLSCTQGVQRFAAGSCFKAMVLEHAEIMIHVPLPCNYSGF